MVYKAGGTCIFFFKQKTAYEIGTGDWSYLSLIVPAYAADMTSHEGQHEPT